MNIQRRIAIIFRMGGVLLLSGAVFFLGMQEVMSEETARRIEEEKRLSLAQEETQLKKNRIAYDYGGWVNYRYDKYEESDNARAVSDQNEYDASFDLRAWGKMVLRTYWWGEDAAEHTIYVRLKNLFIERYPQETAGGYDHDGPHVDQAFINLDFDPVRVECGRRYFSVGRGIAYSDVHDGIEAMYASDEWSLMLFGSRSKPHDENIDTSIPGYDKESERYFEGGEIRLNNVYGHTVYSYLVGEQDQSDEYPEDDAHTYTYNAVYTGVGVEGWLGAHGDYWGEVIHEAGRSFIYETESREPISAWAVVSGAGYSWECMMRPRIEGEYAWGSGDGNRGSVTNTEGGNYGGHDYNFLYFGYMPTGMVLAPRLSNLHMVRASFSAYPFEGIPSMANIFFKVDGYSFFKQRSGGGISDTDASGSGKYVGSEADVSLSYPIFSDMSVVLEYGYFLPGSAYPAEADDGEQFFSVSATVSF